MPDNLFEPHVNHKQIQLEYRESLFQHVDRDASGSYENIFKLCYQCKRTFESPAITTLLEARFGEEAEFHDWHTSTSSFKQSITEQCHFCTIVHTLIETRDPPVTLDGLDPGAAIEFSIKRWLGERGLRQDGFRPSGILRITIKLGGDVEIEIDVKNTMSSYDHWASVHGALDQARTDSVEHVALARLFVNHCMTRHGPFLSSCNWRDGTFVPKRLLELTEDSTGEISEVKLRIMSDEDNEIEYCCLSHCWGEEQPLMLTDANIERLTNGIPVADIPPTYLDAIKITLSLGIRYLWVDSLCIIQGNEQDWTTEAASMSDVYTNAYVTIAAATASTAQDGCYTTRDPLSFAPCRIRGSTKEDVLFAAPRFIKGCEIEDLERTTTLFTRAWVFQERLLSPRILYYGPLGLAFNCRCLFGSETDMDAQPWPLQPTGRKHRELWEDPLSDLEWLRCSKLRDRDFVQKDELHDTWCQVVAAYTPLKMTKPGDKLVALGGVARVVQDVVVGGYVAGLWMGCFIQGLLWHVVTGHEKRPVEYRAPSWSWAAVEGMVRNHDEGTAARFVYLWRRELARVISATASMHDGDVSKTGKVCGAHLRIRGMLKEAQITDPADANQFYSTEETLVFDDAAITGKVHIDALEETRGQAYLMPLLARADKNKHHGLGSNTPCEILGIVLHRDGDTYCRIGNFSASEIMLQHFADCEEQDIVFADGDQK